jgi:gas vesicle protein
MLVLLANITWTDTNKQVAAALIGSLLGAIIGALSTFLIGEHARKKQAEFNEIDKIRQKIKQHTGAMVAAQNNLHNLLVMALKNTGHSRDLAQGIYDSATNRTVFTMNLPQPYKIENGLADGILNTDLVIQWTALELEVLLHNTNTTEFNDYYTFLRTSVHTAQLTNPNSLHKPTIISDSETIAAGAAEQVNACENFRARCIKVLARVELHAPQYKKINYKTVRLEELENYQSKLIDCKPTDKALGKKIKELEEQYTEDKAFAVNAHIS